MSKRATRWFWIVLAALMLMGASLGCDGDTIGALMSGERGEALTLEEAMQYFDDRAGEHEYDVEEGDGSFCGPSSSRGGNASIDLEYRPGSNPDDDVIKVTDGSGTSDYAAHSTMTDRLGNTYCKEVGSPPVLECIELRSWGYQLYRYSSTFPDAEKVCYSATYVMAKDEPAVDDEPVADEEPAVDDEPVTADEPAVDDAPVADDAPAEQISVEGEDGDGATGTVPAGTYEGTTDIPKIWAELPGTDIANEITVIVADDGTVSGSLTVISEGDPRTYEEVDCVSYTDFDISGTPSGRLTGVNGTIQMHIDYHWEIRQTVCNAETVEFDETYDLVTEVQVSGNRMTGNMLEFDTTFEATLQ